MIEKKRARLLKMGKRGPGPVIYWMSRDQRTSDNWALLFAQERAIEQGVPLMVCFSLVTDFPGATLRAYDFMLKGLEETEKTLNRKNIPFILLDGEPPKTIPGLVQDHSASLLITDFDPLRIKREWKDKIAEDLNIPLYEVDTHNIVPCWITSSKREFAARTIRPKINSFLKHYLTPFPDVILHPFSTNKKILPIDWRKVRRGLRTDISVQPISWLFPGSREGQRVLRDFITTKLDRYPLERNNPALNVLSNISPYLHFGQISPQRAAYEVLHSGNEKTSIDAFLEELIVRRELADNFCFYTPSYDKYQSFPDWAHRTLEEHRHDKRENTYSLQELERAETHDDLWNAGQTEMVSRGKMHGWMRMYWAKKILEWSPSPEEALERAIYLNDRYELDGRDPNGYTGIAWSIGGVHDRAWPPHPVFGKIRYMNFRGASRKFHVNDYINKIRNMV